MIHGSAFATSGIANVTVEEGNANFELSEDFLMRGASTVRNFGFEKAIAIKRVSALSVSLTANHFHY
jgi:hypothetical protein